MKFKSSAPGSLMLLGEYAVLNNKYAIVTAINKRITVLLSPRKDSILSIQSQLGNIEIPIEKIKIEPPFHFVLSVIKQHRAKIKKGFDIEIHSDFSDKLGLGSSAAVTVALLSALFAYLKIKTNARELIKHSRMIIREVQGIGSGADVAASVMGGMIGYQAQPLFIEKFDIKLPIILIYSGFKTKTAEAIKQVTQTFSEHPQLFRQIQASIAECALSAMKCIQQKNWEKLGKIMNIQQGLMESLGVCLPTLNAIINDLRTYPGVLGAKISGSGLGDGIIGLGTIPEEIQYQQKFGAELIPVAMSSQGVRCEKI